MQKHVLITGCSSGFGALIARSLLSSGHHVIASLREASGRNAPQAEVLQNFAQSQNQGQLDVLEMDVSQDASVQSAIQQAYTLCPQLDLVINNAGVGAGGLSEGFSAAQMQALFDVNVFGVQRVMQAVLPQMRQAQQGLIINISSTSGRLVLPLSGPYTASKFALEALSESYRYELVGSGVDVCLIEPAGFSTRFIANMQSPEKQPSGYQPQIQQQAEQMQAQIQKQNQTGQAAAGPNPKLVSEAVLKLMDMPAGQRPLRTLVDPSGNQAMHILNRVHAEVQAKFLHHYGYPPQSAF